MITNVESYYRKNSDGSIITGAMPSVWPQSLLHVINNKEQLSGSEWIEKYLILGSHSEEKGPFRLRRTPYLRGILDTATEETSVERIVVCKPAQIAGTTFAVGLIGRFAHIEPCPILLVLADEDTAKFMARERLKKMFEESDYLRTLIDPALWTQDEMGLLNGAYMGIAWASSVAKLASKEMRIVICDETDKPGYSLTTKEGSAIGNAVQRTETFFNRLIVLLSTPTVPEGNIISELTAANEIRDDHVPCPHCGAWQPLRWSIEYAYGLDDGYFRSMTGEMLRVGGVKWEGGRGADQGQIASAVYECGICKKPWSNLMKNDAVAKCIKVPRKEPFYTPKSVGFHLNRLYSLLGRSGDISKLVEDFLDSRQRGPKEMQTFVNSALAEPWIMTLAKTTESGVLKARADYGDQTIPGDVVALTCGVDMQKRGFWFVVRGFARKYKSYLIHYGWIGSYDELENLLFNARYPFVEFEGHKPVVPDLGIWRAGVDMGGGKLDIDIDLTMTEQLYFWIRKQSGRPGPLIWPTKGSSHPMSKRINIGQPIDKTPSGKPLPGGLSIATLDTGALKDAFYYRISQAILGEDVQPAFLHKQTGKDYARQVTAEEKRLNEKGVKEWVRIRKDNHLLDAEVIALALAEPEWQGGGVNLLLPPPPRQPSRKQEPKATEQDRHGGGRIGFRRPKWLDR